MSKVICNVCGTSYPDTATQCPICGCVRDSLAQSVPAQSAGREEGATGYTYVKGGRFSKSNVRKRTGGSAGKAGASNRASDGENRGLIITAIVLFLAIIAVVIFITVKLLAPPADTAGDVTDPAATEQTEDVPEEVLCDEITFDTDELKLDEMGMVEKLVVTVNPEGCTEELGNVISEQPTVATAVLEGNTITITAVGPGETTIKLQCGDKVATCKVICDFKELKIPEEIVLTKADQTKDIYPDDILRTDITWETLDKEIATVDLGTVTAVAEGETIVRATYKGQTAECVVKCDFSEKNEEETDDKKDDTATENESDHNNIVNGTGSVTEDGGTTGGYHLSSLYSSNVSDLTLLLSGEAGSGSVELKLVDSNGNKISDVAWSTDNSDVCSVENGNVKAVGAGMTSVTATYNGETFKCIIRVS